MFLYPHHQWLKKKKRTLGAELKIMPESKQLPSLGTRLKLAWSVHVLRDPWGSACGRPRVSGSLPPTLRRVGVSLLVFMPFCSSLNRFLFLFLTDPYPFLIRASTTADAKPQRDLLETQWYPSEQSVGCGSEPSHCRNCALWGLCHCPRARQPSGWSREFPEIVLHIHLHICCLGWTCVLGFSVSLLICISCLSINYQSGWILWHLASMCKSSILDFSTSSFNVTFIWNKITGWLISNSLLCGRVLGGLSVCFLWLFLGLGTPAPPAVTLTPCL